MRGTINDNPGSLAAAVAEHRPDVIAATFWLFTHRMQIEVLSRAMELLEGTKVICGGPEFLGDNERFLRTYDFVTAVIRGEGEVALPKFLDASDRPERWNDLEGLCWISEADGSYNDNGTARVYDFAALKYPEESIFFNWDKPFVQLETTRGCFNTCEFCVSGGEKPVRYQSLEQVKARLDNICSHGIRDIRVLDRTFNHDIDRACAMLDIFEEYDGRMRFHLEIHPSLISDILKERISSLPKGLLHLEAGIQSLHSNVLAECGRKGSLESSLRGLRFLCSSPNVETHADLIAGLPEYTLEMLRSDIKTLMETGVDELQIESLKVLPGTKMRANASAKGLRYSPLPPYEILLTPHMSAHDLRTAMQTSRMTDLYYNCGTWQGITRKLVMEIPGFLSEFTGFLAGMMVLDSPVSMERRGVLLYEYCKSQCPEYLTDISIAWIRGGFSLKKEPAGNILKIKHLDAFLEEKELKMTVVYGTLLPSHRYYLLKGSGRLMVFGYDSESHKPEPSMMAELI